MTNEEEVCNKHAICNQYCMLVAHAIKNVAYAIEDLDDLRGRLVDRADHRAAAFGQLLEQLHHLVARRAVQATAHTYSYTLQLLLRPLLSDTVHSVIRECRVSWPNYRVFCAIEYLILVILVA